MRLVQGHRMIHSDHFIIETTASLSDGAKPEKGVPSKWSEESCARLIRIRTATHSTNGSFT